MNYLICAIVLLISYGLAFLFSYSSSLDEVKDWIRQKSYSLITSDLHMTTVGTPFLWMPSNGMIFELDVMTEHGEKEKWWYRQGTICINSKFIKVEEQV